MLDFEALRLLRNVAAYSFRVGNTLYSDFSRYPNQNDATEV
jgi:hypothetical protein